MTMSRKCNRHILELIETCDSSYIVLQVDFSENCLFTKVKSSQLIDHINKSLCLLAMFGLTIMRKRAIQSSQTTYNTLSRQHITS